MQRDILIYVWRLWVCYTPECNKGMSERVDREKTAEYHVNNPIYPLDFVEEVLEME